VHNAGPAPAFDFDVRFRISEPYHTVGGDADFDKFVGIVHIDVLPPPPPNQPLNTKNVFVPWTPVASDKPHDCVKVDLINLVGTDTNEHDNWAQENLWIDNSYFSSPFNPVTYSYNLTNPYDHPALFYFRADGAPTGWKVELNPNKIHLKAGERMVGQTTITPSKDARVCTSERIEVTSWTPRGDTLINVGGAIVQVDLRRPTAITLEVEVGSCRKKDWDELIREAKKNGKDLDPKIVRKRCGKLAVHGCLEPPLPGQGIVLKYVDPLGNVTYHTVKTDENGCFEDLFVSVTGGTWQMSAEYSGGECNAPVVEGPLTACWCHQ
jgi:hypothetical protein